jgi:tRNA(fMet)-specific endonuclease VapC
MELNKIALDTNVAIEVLNNNKLTIEVLKQFDLIYLPVTVCGEMLYGAKNSSRLQYNLPRYQSLIASCEILNTEDKIADEYSSIKKQLRDAGSPIPENDIWIAAICMFYNIPLFSHDSHFDYVLGLKRY